MKWQGSPKYWGKLAALIGACWSIWPTSKKRLGASDQMSIQMLGTSLQPTSYNNPTLRNHFEVPSKFRCMPYALQLLIVIAPTPSIQDDYPIHHRGIHGLQPLLPQSQNSAPLPLLPPTECAADYESKYQAITADIEGPEFCGVEVQ